ncbi:MAG: hypothetical protein A4E34_02210 [Methanoregula sp. PtaU1.Bin006]|nr:MAG: hypothetical protein A4E34_02210 [Methanoregula sp. PtaU1.Bin006]
MTRRLHRTRPATPPGNLSANPVIPLSRCPFCGSEKVYSLLGTQHCKRCKGVWHGKNTGSTGPGSGETPGGIPAGTHLPAGRPRADPLPARLEKELESCLRKNGGRFSRERIRGTRGTVQEDLFRHYLRVCVRNGTLTEKRDRHGITWYSRPG